MKILYIQIVVMVTTIACAPVYIPNQLQAPLLKEQGEFTASVSTGTSTFDLQAAYSPIKHLDLLTDLTYANSSNNKHLQLEGGLGFYQNYDDLLQLEFLAGGGSGYASSTSVDNIGIRKEGRYSRFYIQPNIFILAKYFEFGLATRASVVQFREYGRGYYIEPVLVLRAGSPTFKIQIQGGLSLNTNDNSSLHYNPVILNVGLVYVLRKNSLETP